MEQSRRYFNALLILNWINFGVGHYFTEIMIMILGSSLGTIAAQVIRISIVIVLVLASRDYILRHIRNKHLFYCIIAVLYFFAAYLLYIENRQYIQEYIPVFLFSMLPLIVLGICIEPDYALCKALSKASAVIVLLNLLYYFYYIYSGRMWEGDSMSFVSMNLPSLLMLIGWSVNVHNRRNTILLSIFAILFTILLGSRGGILCILSYLLLLGYRYFKTQKRSLVFVIGGVSIISIALVFWKNIVTALSRLVTMLGGSARVVDMLQMGEFHQDSNRFQIIETAFRGILERNPFFGGGIFGDRVIFGSATYVHNIAIEFICNFGFVFGIFLLILLIQQCLKNYNKDVAPFHQTYFLILVSLGLVKLFVSGSYLTSEYFMLFLGYLLGAKYRIQMLEKQTVAQDADT